MTRRKALLVGINYRGTNNELQGCINDVLNIKQKLLLSGYRESDITLMTDDTPIKPTRVNIIQSLVSLILSGAENLFMHYSGHGTSMDDTNGDEVDGKDEALCPIDCDTEGMILDDELRGILQLVTERQKMTCFFDCCHSGTALDLSYVLYQKYAGRKMFMIKDNEYVETRGQVVLFSGCMDWQTSADAFIKSTSQGAMTASLINALDTGNKTYQDIITSMRNYMKQNGYEQIPNLSSGNKLELSDRFMF